MQSRAYLCVCHASFIPWYEWLLAFEFDDSH